MAEFTPGPWTYWRDTCARCEEKGEAEFVIDGPPGAYHGQFSSEGDARLIAASPDLYEALIGMLPIVFTGSPTSAQNIAHWERERDLGNGQASAVLAAYAALAKAEGEVTAHNPSGSEHE